jgi:hypothetical protein
MPLKQNKWLKSQLPQENRYMHAQFYHTKLALAGLVSTFFPHHNPYGMRDPTHPLAILLKRQE